jgi:hypothetical protein
MPRIPADPDLRQAIASALHQQPPLTHAAISATLGCGAPLVAKVARELGLLRDRGGARLVSPHRDRARELRDQGLTLAGIAAELGISRERVRQLLLDP